LEPFILLITLFVLLIQNLAPIVKQLYKKSNPSEGMGRAQTAEGKISLSQSGMKSGRGVLVALW
jgi:hypothetical protein